VAWGQPIGSMPVVGRVVEWVVSAALKREGSVNEEILRNNAEERSSHVLRGGSYKSGVCRTGIQLD